MAAQSLSIQSREKTSVQETQQPPRQLGRSSESNAVANDELQQAAAAGVSGGGSLPFLDQIQASFGHHDVEGVTAAVGGDASSACDALGASGFATGDRVGFRETPDLHTAAHEAAHTVQQRGGVQLSGGISAEDDRYEAHADAVADAVVAGESAQELLDQPPGGGGSTGVQLKTDAKPAPEPSITLGAAGGEAAYGDAKASADVQKGQLSVGAKVGGFEFKPPKPIPLPLPGLSFTWSIAAECFALAEMDASAESAGIAARAKASAGIQLVWGAPGILSVAGGAKLELTADTLVSMGRGGLNVEYLKGGLTGSLGAELDVAGLFKIPWEGPKAEILKFSGLVVKNGELVGTPSFTMGADLARLVDTLKRLSKRVRDYTLKPWTLWEDSAWLLSLGADFAGDALERAKEAYDASVRATQEGISAVAGELGVGTDIYALQDEVQAGIDETNSSNSAWDRQSARLQELKGYYDPFYYNAAYKMYQRQDYDLNLPRLVSAAKAFKAEWPKHEERNWELWRPSNPEQISAFEGDKRRFRALWRASFMAPYTAVKEKPPHRFEQVLQMEEACLVEWSQKMKVHARQVEFDHLSDAELLERLEQYSKHDVYSKTSAIAEALRHRGDITRVRQAFFELAKIMHDYENDKVAWTYTRP